jgi:threonine synthase
MSAMRYISTRGSAPPVGFLDAVLAGMAPDGGLYAPETWPAFDADIFDLCVNAGYADIATDVLAAFAGDDLTADEAADIAFAAYDRLFEPPRARFTHDAVAPLAQIGGGAWMLELFHGPSLAFKDVAMQLIARLYDHALAKRGGRLSIVCATSGDTGGAAVEAFKGSDAVDLFVLLPRGRASDVQQRFMTTSGAANVHCLLVDGDFDACQALLKTLLQDRDFAARASLSVVNSINWARILAQSVYFVIAASVLSKLERGGGVSLAIPTGNFGDAFSAFVAAKLGAPIAAILAAVNANDFLWRGYTSGNYERRETVPTISPAMDIQAPSNFERYVFERTGRDAGEVKRLFTQFAATGAFRFSGGRANEPLIAVQAAGEAQTQEAMRRHLQRTGALACPHTAVGLAAAHIYDGSLPAPVIHLATAHPAKFPDTVEDATGRRPALPAQHQNLFARAERFDEIAADLELVKQYIRERTRAWT